MVHLSGRVALISGGSKGIGFGIAKRLAERGVEHLVLLARDIAQLNEAKVFIEQHYKTTAVDVMRADLTDVRVYDAIVDHITNTYQKIDILVNNAGDFALLPKKVRDSTGTVIGVRDKPSQIAEDIFYINTLNLGGPIALTTVLLPLLKKSPQPKILDVLSSAAVEYFPGNEPYRQTKTGHMDFSVKVAVESGGAIKTYRVYPSNTQTRLVAEFDGKKLSPDYVGAQSVDMLLDETATDLYMKMLPSGEIVQECFVFDASAYVADGGFDGLAFPQAHRARVQEIFHPAIRQKKE